MGNFEVLKGAEEREDEGKTESTKLIKCSNALMAPSIGFSINCATSLNKIATNGGEKWWGEVTVRVIMEFRVDWTEDNSDIGALEVGERTRENSIIDWIDSWGKRWNSPL